MSHSHKAGHDATAAKNTVKHRVIDSSIGGYKSKLNRIKTYLIHHEKGKDYVDDDDEIILPLPKDVVEDLFGWIGRSPELARAHQRLQDQNLNVGSVSDDEGDEDDETDGLNLNKQTISISAMGNYASALKWLYREREVQMEQEIVQFLSDTMKGYKKIVSKKNRMVLCLSRRENALLPLLDLFSLQVCSWC